jgi:hypothetical protein
LRSRRRTGRCEFSAPHELPHQLHGSRLAALPLYEEIENLAFVINRTPKPELLAGNDHRHLIEMPTRG